MFVIYQTTGGEVTGYIAGAAATAPTVPSGLSVGAVTASELAEITDLIADGYILGEPLEPYKAYFEAFYNPANPVGSRVSVATYGGGVPPVPSELAAALRLQRNALLAATDFTQLADVPISSALRTDFADYRQDLRDVPQQGGFPSSVTWPTAPTYVKT